MKKITKLFIASVILLFVFIGADKDAFAQEKIADNSASQNHAIFDKDFEFKNYTQIRQKQLQAYLSSVNSPLVNYAKVFIEKADAYQLPDWRLVPAITGVESTFGIHIPYNSYNAYGWANGNYAFASWEESIDVVTKALKEKYYDRGYDSVEKISAIYAPPSTTWSFKVSYFMEKISNYKPTKPEQLDLAI